MNQEYPVSKSLFVWNVHLSVLLCLHKGTSFIRLAFPTGQPIAYGRFRGLKTLYQVLFLFHISGPLVKWK